MPRAFGRKGRHAVSNAEVARARREMALFLEMDEVPFKPRAYEKAALVVGALDRPLHEVAAEGGIKGLAELPGVGKGIAERIHELVQDRPHSRLGAPAQEDAETS
jgi:DNA polymerase (family 10)